MKKYSIFLLPILTFLLTYFLINLYSAITLTAFCIIFVLLFRFKKDITGELVIALLFALFITYYQHYVYEGFNFFIGTINVYTFILWTLALVLLRELYEYLGNRFFITSIIYLILLFSVEYIGYSLLGFHRTGNYPGIFGLDIIHGPPLVHYFYILAGPVYLLVTKFLKIK